MFDEVDAHFLDKQIECIELNFGYGEFVSSEEDSMYEPISNDFIEQRHSLWQRRIP